jgi:hypothetical protein
VKYIVRLRKGRYEAEKSLIIGEDGEVELFFNGERLKGIWEKRPERALELKELGSMKVRLIKGIPDNGEEAFFITNEKGIKTGELKDLYKKRWSMEQS